MVLRAPSDTGESAITWTLSGAPIQIEREIAGVAASSADTRNLLWYTWPLGEAWEGNPGGGNAFDPNARKPMYFGEKITVPSGYRYYLESITLSSTAVDFRNREFAIEVTLNETVVITYWKWKVNDADAAVNYATINKVNTLSIGDMSAPPTYIMKCIMDTDKDDCSDASHAINITLLFRREPQ